MYTVKLVTTLVQINQAGESKNVWDVNITFKCGNLTKVNEVLKRFNFANVRVNEFKHKTEYRLERKPMFKAAGVYELHTANVIRDELYGKSVNIAPTGREGAVIASKVSAIKNLSFED